MNRPALKRSICFAIGIIAGQYIRLAGYVWLALCFLLFVSLCPGFLLHRTGGRGFRFLWMALVIVSAGAHYSLRTQHVPPHHISRFLDNCDSLEVTGEIASLPEIVEGRTTFYLSVDSMAASQVRWGVEGKIRVTIGEAAGQFAYGDMVSFRGQLDEPPGLRNPGGFDYRAYLNRQGVHGVIFLKSAEPIQILARDQGNPLLAKLVWPIKRSIQKTFEQNLSGPPQALLTGIMLGDRSNVPGSIERVFQDSGVVHVLSVSGLHVSLVVFLFFSLLRALRLPFNWVVGFTVVITLGYMVVTGSKPPVVRAALMTTIVLVGLALERNVDLLNTVAFAGLVTMIVSPSSLFDPGFQLSFVSVVSIIYMYPRLEEWIPMRFRKKHTYWRRFLLGGTLVSLSAQLGIAPVVAYYFFKIPLISLLANLVVIPWVGVVLALGFAAAISGAVCMPVALLFNASNWLALSGLIKAVEMFASAPCAYVQVARPGLLDLSCYYCLLALFVNVRRVYWARRWLVIAGLCSANMGIWISALDGDHRLLKVTFLDVGSGDAIVIRSPQGKTMLIDGGRRSPYEDCGERVLLPFLRSSGYHRIDAILMSHPHADHLGGLLAVMRQFNVGQILESGARTPSSLCHEYETVLQARGISQKVVRAGESLPGFEPLSIRFLHPAGKFVTPEGWPPYGVNNGSVVMRLDYGRVSFLFMGDVEHAAEEALLGEGEFLKADVIKISHQGSRTGTSERLLAAIRPSLAVISVGQGNPFHHPDREVIARLEHRGIHVYRTDRNGAVMVSTDGENIRVRTMVPCHREAWEQEIP